MSNAGSGERPVLQLDSVSITLGSARRVVRALDDVSLSVAHARITGVVGPDGAGKTTLMRAAAGLLDPDAGAVRVLGADPAGKAGRAAGVVGYMPQHFGLYEELTVAENLDLYADLQGVAPRDRGERYGELMRMTGLAPFLDRRAGRLSGGMQRKLGLACALVRAPRLLLLDEPTVGVDPVSRRELWAIVGRLVREESVSVLVSTAYLDEVDHCDEVIVLDRGRLVNAGRPERFVATMRDRVYAATLDETRLHAFAGRAAASTDVVDAVLERGRVRVVSAAAVAPRIEAGDAPLTAATMVPIVPRFEDYFVDALTRASGRGPHRMHRGSGPLIPDRASDEVVIEVEDVWRRFGSFVAVRGVSFDVRRGEIFGLLGANGAGKSTTFRMLCGLLPASAGRLRVTGIDLRRAPAAARARVGYVAQRFSLYAALTVVQNLRFFASAYGLARRRRDERVHSALDEFGLADVANAPSGDLPLGFRQRLALAAALLHEPDILFLDEATSGVDPLARREFWHRITALAATGVTVLVTTHFMEEAENCHRLVVMQAGRILAEGSPGTIRAAARTATRPRPSMEEAFVGLIEAADPAAAA